MRAFVIAGLALVLAGCGSSSSSPPPKATPVPTQGYADPRTHLAVHVDRVRKTASYSLLLVTMRNTGAADFQLTGPLAFLDSAFSDPSSKAVNGTCDADSSVGDSLDYTAVPAHSMHRGWIRCDYPTTSRVVAIIWQGHQVDAFRVSSS